MSAICHGNRLKRSPSPITLNEGELTIVLMATMGLIPLLIIDFPIGVEQLAHTPSPNPLSTQITASRNLFLGSLEVSIKCKRVSNPIQKSIPKVIHFQLVYAQLIKEVIIS